MCIATWQGLGGGGFKFWLGGCTSLNCTEFGRSKCSVGVVSFVQVDVVLRASVWHSKMKLHASPVAASAGCLSYS
jgi:hypothetical protein